MKAEIITIGDEILTGQTIDTNSAYIATQLNLIGIPVLEIKSIRDTRHHIINSLDTGLKEVDIIILTGGLGPTNDDITKNVLTEYFDDHLIMHDDILKEIESYFNDINVSVLEVNRQQAMLPQNARIIKNDWGTASGMWFTKDNKHVISLPGVPYEMIALTDKLMPLLQEEFSLADFYHKTVLFQGMGESRLAEELKDIEIHCKEQKIGVAYLPSPGIVKIRFTGVQRQSRTIDTIIDELIEKFPKLAFGKENETLEEIVGMILKEKGLTVGTVESCTGGGLANRIVQVSGASNYFMGSIIAYDNRIKSQNVGVPQTLLDEFGAVSKQAVISMAENGRNKLGVDYCISTSGIAGPSGGTPDKPVGTVWIGIAGPDGTFAKKFRFKHNRERNIELSIVYALNFLRRVLRGFEIPDKSE